MENLMQCIINTHFFNIVFKNTFGNYFNIKDNKNEDNNKELIPYKNIFKNANESRRKFKYTKLLQIKTNREKDIKKKENNKKDNKKKDNKK